ncbi:cdkn1a interacting zinc finger protein 1a [Centropristis striata]|uniref:cdkn1a interacting zinc finger protein 1a n=1 Tax=Centropristis striata TaxID=184440 RepID=UPI0027E0B999|nr:cdkn1a interacting zinc finger protein 1a [Centropristis striata]XP_059214103.1 cdkn1a interacting zinc finger protein 1a [Centropristis striata]
MFNPHIHQQQQQQQQQFHQHLRQLQQLFQQQPPPPPPPQPPPGHHVPHHHHQAQRSIPVTPQTAPPPRMVNLCQTTQTTIMAPNPMLQGALLMQQMQGNMRNFGMGGQQFRQFFAARARSSLLGPVPMGMGIKTPMMGFPAARPYHPHARYYNNNNTNNTITTTAPSSSAYSSSITYTDTAARQPDRKRDSEQMADDQPAASSTNETTDKTETDGAVGGVGGPTQPSEERLEEPVLKKQRTEGSEEPKEQCVVETDTVTVTDTDVAVLSAECNSNTEDSQLEDCIILEEGGSAGGSDVILQDLEESRAAEVHSLLAPSPSGGLTEEDQQVNLFPEEMPQDKDAPLALPDNQEEEEVEGVADGANKFYCYLCGITCHNQQNFRSHMNSVSHQQRMMEIQHMSNACLVTLLPRVQESLQEANKDGEKKHWCATCHTYFTSSIMDHRRTEEHKVASRAAISSCTVCKKHFRTSQIFVEHLQSQEHRQKVEKLQEQEGCESLGKLTAMDTDGFSLEEVEGSEVEEEEERPMNEKDEWSFLKEVTLKDMASDEQYDADTVYGSSFFVPVAGFICRLCNKFYHFESSALHTHCKSLKHFENLKTYRELLNQKSGAVESSRESPPTADSLRPETEKTTHCSDENSLSDDTGLETNPDSRQPTIALTPLKMQTENQEQEEPAEPDPTSQDLISTSATSTGSTDQELTLHSKEETTSEASVVQETPAELLADSREEQVSEQAAAVEDANAEEQVSEQAAAVEDANAEEEEAPAVIGKKSGTGKAKPKRRSGRASNRR